MFGLEKTKTEVVRNLFPKKLRFDFMIPSSFYELLKILNQLTAYFPSNFESDKRPSTISVFDANLFNFLKKNDVTTKYQKLK